MAQLAQAERVVAVRGWLAARPSINLPRKLPSPLRAIYLAFNSSGKCRYVGSVARVQSGLRQRIREHLLHHPVRRHTWVAIGVIELAETCPLEQVRILERLVADRVGGPGGRGRVGALVDLVAIPRYRGDFDHSREVV